MEIMSNIVENNPRFFSNNPVDFDVVISSRVRLVRNLENYPFPEGLNDEERKEVQQKVISAFQNLEMEEKFAVIDPENLEPVNMKKIFEQNITEEHILEYGGNPLIVSMDGMFIATINDENHLALSCITNGLDLKNVFRRTDKIDTELENHLGYACSLQWGYHCTSVTDIGTGLKASVTLHLPALTLANLVGDVKNSFARSDYIISGVYKEDEESFGDLYQVSNQISFGLNEKESLRALTEIIKPIIKLERKTRSELIEAGKFPLEDRIFRAFGILKYCRSITFKEAIEHLSYLRMGISLGIIDEASLRDITALFFLIQDNHIKKIAATLNLVEKGQNFFNMTRSKMIRDLLEIKEDI